MTEYEDIDFTPPTKPSHAKKHSSGVVPVVQPVPPQRTSSRYVDKHPAVSGGGKPVPPVLASKPKRPLPPPKPRTYESFDETNGTSTSPSHELKRQSQSIDVPALPPRPQHVTSPSKSQSFDTSHDRVMHRTNILKDMSQLPGKQMSLSEFVKNHSKELPLRVRVDEGFCGNDERFIISTGDVYNLHFLKTVKVASIQDFGGVNFSVPLNSSVKFGLLYNPENNFYQSVQGYTFDNVTAITTAKVQPKLIFSTKECLCSDPKSSLEANELLLIKKVGKTALKRRPYIKVFNIKTKEEKTLYDDCEGSFTTAPSALQLFLPELLEHLGDFLPLQAMLYADTESQDSDDLPLRLTTEMVTLTHISLETSIVATTYWGEDDTGLSEEDFTPIAIPLELEIEITVLQDESEDEDLYSNTKTLLNTFDPLKIKDMAEAKTDKAAQSRLYKNVRKGYELSGLQIEPPSRIYDVVGPSPILPRATTNRFLPSDPPSSHRHTTPSPSPSPNTASLLPNHPHNWTSSEGSNGPPRPRSPRGKAASYQYPRSVKAPPFQSNASAESAVIQKPTGSVEDRIADLHSNTRALKCLVDAMQDNSGKITSDLKSELKRLGRVVENLSRNYERLERQVEELRNASTVPDSARTPSPKTPARTPSPKTPATHQDDYPRNERSQNAFSFRRSSSVKKTADPDIRAKNVEELASMDCGEVLSLLAALNMSQYQKNFEEEQVDGEVLIECDDEVLRTELNVSSLIHRKKLMSVINGSQSPLSVIQSSENRSDVSR